MRIISGKYRGRRLNPTKLNATRPTTDFAREGLFNMLNSRIDWDDLEVLDLYSGSGAMAFEFLSRGVKAAVALDNNSACVKFISSIKQEWNVDNLDVLKYDSLRYLESCRMRFDLIFADPPYHSEDYQTIHDLVFEGQLLNANGYLILEHRKELNFEKESGFVLQRAFGNVNFSIFSPINSNEQ